MSVGAVVDIVREPLLKHIEKLETFVAFYDAWRKAEDDFEEASDSGVSGRKLQKLANDEASAQLMLIKTRDALQKSTI